MNPVQKAAAASRRARARHALVDALQFALEGLPVSVKESGSIRFGDDVADSQFDEVARVVASFSSQNTTMCSFAKCDLWAAAVKRYGGGIHLMRRIYGETEIAERQAVVWRGLCKIGRRVPEQDRDMSRTWNYYRYEYGREESGPIDLGGNAVTGATENHSFRITQMTGDVREVLVQKYHGEEYTANVLMKNGSRSHGKVKIQELAAWAANEVLDFSGDD